MFQFGENGGWNARESTEIEELILLTQKYLHCNELVDLKENLDLDSKLAASAVDDCR